MEGFERHRKEKGTKKWWTEGSHHNNPKHIHKGGQDRSTQPPTNPKKQNTPPSLHALQSGLHGCDWKNGYGRNSQGTGREAPLLLHGGVKPEKMIVSGKKKFKFWRVGIVHFSTREMRVEQGKRRTPGQLEKYKYRPEMGRGGPHLLGGLRRVDQDVTDWKSILTGETNCTGVPLWVEIASSERCSVSSQYWRVGDKREYGHNLTLNSLVVDGPPEQVGATKNKNFENERRCLSVNKEKKGAVAGGKCLWIWQWLLKVGQQGA